jgi:small subunit ribosomal protein S16
MAVVLRLMRAGAKKRPAYRVVAADSRRQRDGRFLEILGHYDPIAKPYTLKLDHERIAVWIAKGAQPSVQVASLMKLSGMKVEKTPKPAKPEAQKAAKKAVRRVKRTLSERKVKARAARKAGKKKPAVKKPKKK